MTQMLSEKKAKFVEIASRRFTAGAILSKDDIKKIVDDSGIPYPFWFVTQNEYRVDRGKYKLPLLDTGEIKPMLQSPLTDTNPDPKVSLDDNMVRMSKLHDESEIVVPEEDSLYVPFGFFSDMEMIFANKLFHPIMVTGPSGNGKTKMVLQAANRAKRKLIRTNVSIETDQTDLLGGPILVNGNIVNRDGPVILAMKHGAILLLDEIDRGSKNLLCLQSIMEGEPYFNKNTGETINPIPGFQVVATANTKGKGSDDGKYLAQILDDAFLERFPITVEQSFPTETIENKILAKVFETSGIDEPEFISNLITWANTTRKLAYEGVLDELISTRRLVDICRTYAIFKNREKAVTLCIHRFDRNTMDAFLEYYKKIDSTVKGPEIKQAPPQSSTADIWFEEITQ